MATMRPSETSARRAIEAFLEEKAPGLPDYDLCKDGDDGWAFWICPHDTTAYLHADMAIEWYGTGWPANYDYDEGTGLFVEKAVEQNCVADLQAWAVTVCERRGIRLVEAEEDEVKGRWDWIFEEQGMACESSFETQGAAALDAVETHFIVRDYEKEAYKAKQDKVFFPTYRDWVDLKADMELGKNTVSARPGM